MLELFWGCDAHFGFHVNLKESTQPKTPTWDCLKLLQKGTRLPFALLVNPQKGGTEPQQVFGSFHYRTTVGEHAHPELFVSSPDLRQQKTVPLQKTSGRRPRKGKHTKNPVGKDLVRLAWGECLFTIPSGFL